MNAETGQIFDLTDGEIQENLLRMNLVPVSDRDMTAKQKAEMQVSLADRRSKLGKLRTAIASGKRIPRNAPCPCGSGHKYKKCHGRTTIF